MEFGTRFSDPKWDNVRNRGPNRTKIRISLTKWDDPPEGKCYLRCPPVYVSYACWLIHISFMSNPKIENELSWTPRNMRKNTIELPSQKHFLLSFSGLLQVCIYIYISSIKILYIPSYKPTSRLGARSCMGSVHVEVPDTVTSIISGDECGNHSMPETTTIWGMVVYHPFIAIYGHSMFKGLPHYNCTSAPPYEGRSCAKRFKQQALQSLHAE